MIVNIHDYYLLWILSKLDSEIPTDMIKQNIWSVSMRIFPNDIALWVSVYSKEKGTMQLARGQSSMYPQGEHKNRSFTASPEPITHSNPASKHQTLGTITFALWNLFQQVARSSYLCNWTEQCYWYSRLSSLPVTCPRIMCPNFLW